MALTFLHPFDEGCPRTLDALFSDAISGQPCGLETCDACGLSRLVDDVAATSCVLGRGHSIVVNITTLARGLPPDEIGPFAFPRAVLALESLRARYWLFEFAWVVEVSERGTAHLHVLQKEGSEPSRRSLRKAFDEAGLGTAVRTQPIERPLTLAAYIAKTALFAVRQPDERGGRLCVTFVRELHAGAALFPRSRRLLPSDSRDRAALAAKARPAVLRWVANYDFEPKMPPLLLDRLADIRVRDLERVAQLRRMGAGEEEY